ncbi:MAG: cystathionine gamma-synthase [Gammaproteobacteria bacterium]|nr:cystathionine gamma-synthase [Gammaproteobacteria bacterium]
MKARNPSTVAVRSGLASDSQHGAVIPPVHLSSNFTFAGYAQQRQYDYTRSGNPTRDLLGSTLAELEGAAGAVVTSSGMAALTLLLQLVDPGDLVIAPHDCYGGTHRLLKHLASRGQFRLEFVDQTSAQGLGSVQRNCPRLVLVESPSNPLLRIVDISRIAGLAKRAGALLAVDNTFLSPALQTPIDLGADLVVHSTTKYLNGHSDVVGGAIVAATTELANELGAIANTLGITGAPFDSYLTLRGVRTLQARVRQHEDNARQLAGLLDNHPAVAAVHYPGLSRHPGHQIAAAQQRGFGGMLSFELQGGTGAVQSFLESLQLFSLAESLGGVESLVCHPRTMTHAAMSNEACDAAGISAQLIRLSVGIEDIDDLAADVLNSLGSIPYATMARAIA